jgi:hypothetical protein
MAKTPITLKFEIDSNNVVRIWNDLYKQEAPIILQDINPTGEAWANKEEAESWAVDYINMHVKFVEDIKEATLVKV